MGEKPTGNGKVWSYFSNYSSELNWATIRDEIGIFFLTSKLSEGVDFLEMSLTILLKYYLGFIEKSNNGALLIGPFLTIHFFCYF